MVFDLRAITHLLGTNLTILSEKRTTACTVIFRLRHIDIFDHRLYHRACFRLLVISTPGPNYHFSQKVNPELILHQNPYTELTAPCSVFSSKREKIQTNRLIINPYRNGCLIKHDKINTANIELMYICGHLIIILYRNGTNSFHTKRNKRLFTGNYGEKKLYFRHN